MFSKKSNVNAHVKSVHKGHRFICSACEESFSAKSSLRRHFERSHVLNMDNGSTQIPYKEQEFLVDENNLVLTDEAKTAKIIRLERKITELGEKIANILRQIENKSIPSQNITLQNESKEEELQESIEQSQSVAEIASKQNSMAHSNSTKRIRRPNSKYVD